MLPNKSLKRTVKQSGHTARAVALLRGPVCNRQRWPAVLRLIKGFRDEAFAGEWKGYRSSRLGDQWRVIYRVVADETLFQVASITAHDYRRP